MRPLIAVLMLVAAAASAQSRVTVGERLGFAEQVVMLGSGRPSSQVQMVFGEPDFSIALVRSHGMPRLELGSELLLGQTIQPGSRFTLGLTEVLRFQGNPSGDAGWFMEIGAGVSDSSMRIRELSGRMQYKLQLGGGVRVVVGDGWWMTVGVRVTHFSNNGTGIPNAGLNLPTLLFGVRYRLP